ncbi:MULTISPECIES: ABC transporter permease [Paracoccus]|uniref:Glycine betaine/proline transport system permease protein n=1 Tax=Paracoccus versutus TaxID=34007 RepID=A0A3D9XXW4_PARVE|nr:MULTISPECIES: ABC transporter permease subunit [Paracoccus]MBT0781310.1 ABC transporter permease subunit [Paracoccus sp. pheM1]REF73102.1 glycine betaine/proline transport system permease protein [Paracoccus versutus]WGR54994.1 ABC transporter permease subunit [Paracoccus versutus]
MTFQFSIGTWLAPFVDWLNANLHGLFDVIGRVVEAVLGAFQSLLLYPPAIVVILLVTITVALLTGLRVALLAFLCLGFCWLMNLWPQSMQTIALVFTAVVAAVAIAVPLGIMASRRPRLEAALRPILDIMQTVPPWVYLIPAVILFSLGQVPALLATVVYGIPPMLRLTTLAFRQVPKDLLELGQAIGAPPRIILTRIEFPAALPTLVVGLNQCILLSLAMVVLAGLVGAGGLGAEVTRGLTRMEMGLGLRAGLAIVAIALLFDRVSRSALQRPAGGSRI